MSEKFSYSRLDSYNQCPYKYKLQYVDKNFCSADNANIRFGILVHKVFELVANTLMAGNPVDYDNLVDYFYNAHIVSRVGRGEEILGSKYIEKKFPEEWNAADKVGRTFNTKVRRFIKFGIHRLENYLTENPDLEIVGAEIPFEYEYRGYVFRGYIDRVLRHKSDPKNYEIHDIKTSTAVYDDRKIKSPTQLYIYACALQSVYGDDIVCDCVYDFPIADAFKHAGTKGWEKRCQKKIDQLLDGIEASDYTPNPSPLCYYCNYCNNNPNQPVEGKNLCPYYSLWTPDNPNYGVYLPWLGVELDDTQRKKLTVLNSEVLDLEI